MGDRLVRGRGREWGQKKHHQLKSGKNSSLISVLDHHVLIMPKSKQVIDVTFFFGRLLVKRVGNIFFSSLFLCSSF